MSEGMNRVVLFGNVGACELRFTQAGSAALNLRLATTETYLDKDKARQERTEWHDVVVFGKRGEALAKLLGKGSAILVEGSLRTSSYEDRLGAKRYRTQIVANNVMLGGRGNGRRAEQGGGSDRPHAAPDASGDDFDLGGGGGGGFDGGRGPVDDIPFATNEPNAWGL